MEKLKKLKTEIINQLESYSGNTISTGTLDTINKLAHAAKNLCALIEREEGYSQQEQRGMQYQQPYSVETPLHYGTSYGYGGSYGYDGIDHSVRPTAYMPSNRRMPGYSRAEDGAKEDIMEAMKHLPEHKQQKLKAVLDEM